MMNFDMELFKDNTLFSYIVGIIGILATIVTIRNAFSVFARRQELKIELEIFELLKRNSEFDSSKVKESIDAKTNRSFQTNEDGLMSLIVGFVLFSCFGYLTYILLQDDGFNGWIILTLFVSLTGLTMMFGKAGAPSNKEVFLKIGFYDRANFRFTIILVLCTGILFPVLLFKTESTIGLIVSGVLFLIGLTGLMKSIKKI